jgi:hypothetical protein
MSDNAGWVITLTTLFVCITIGVVSALIYTGYKIDTQNSFKAKAEVTCKVTEVK